MHTSQDCIAAVGKTVCFVSKDKQYKYEGKVVRATIEEKSQGVVVNSPIRYKLNKNGEFEEKGETMDGKVYIWSEYPSFPENSFHWFLKESKSEQEEEIKKAQLRKKLQELIRSTKELSKKEKDRITNELDYANAILTIKNSTIEHQNKAIEDLNKAIDNAKMPDKPLDSGDYSGDNPDAVGAGDGLFSNEEKPIVKDDYTEGNEEGAKKSGSALTSN